MKTEHMPIAEWADGHNITVAEAMRWIARAQVKPTMRGLTPRQWTTLDEYVYVITGKSCCASLQA